MALGIINEHDDEGRLISVGIRDCFHVPCVMAHSNVAVRRGAPVRFSSEYFEECRPCDDFDSCHGLVDPFIPVEVVGRGTQFWVVLRPGMARGIRHGFEVNEVEYTGYDGEIDTSCRGCG